MKIIKNLLVLLIIASVGVVAFYFLFDSVFATTTREEIKEAKQRSIEQEQNLTMKPTVIGGVTISVYNYNGHEYIIADGGYGCCIIHSESCQCKNQ